MSYTKSDRFKKWVRVFNTGIDRIYEKGAPNSGDDAEHAEFRAAYVAMLEEYVASIKKPDDWLTCDEDDEPTQERVA